MIYNAVKRMLFEKNREKSLIELLRTVYVRHYSENCEDINIGKFRITLQPESIYVNIDSEDIHCEVLCVLFQSVYHYNVINITDNNESYYYNYTTINKNRNNVSPVLYLSSFGDPDENIGMLDEDAWFQYGVLYDVEQFKVLYEYQQPFFIKLYNNLYNPNVKELHNALAVLI